MRQYKYKYWYNGKMLEVGQIEFMTDGTYLVNEELVGGTLREWTGLLDKNGKEIYEEDIITYPILGKDEPIKREVKFYNGAFGVFTGNGTRYPTGGATTEFGLLGNGLVHEVIGNVWESPELLVPTPSK